jgi:hypothetical protein
MIGVALMLCGAVLAFVCVHCRDDFHIIIGVALCEAVLIFICGGTMIRVLLCGAVLIFVCEYRRRNIRKLHLELRAAGDGKPEQGRGPRDFSPQRALGSSVRSASPPSGTPAPRARSALQLLEEVVGACVQYGHAIHTRLKLSGTLTPCEHSVCAICLDNFDNRVTARCGHAFCKDCIVEWDRNERLARRKPCCPLCRAPL